MLTSLVSFALAATPLLVREARVVDARGDQGLHSLLLEDGLITAIDPEEVPDAATELDAHGRAVLPGYIDTHVHISIAPGEAWYTESHEARRARRAHHLRSYLAWGVTTLLDPAILPDDAREILELAQEGPAPRLRFLGPTFSPLDGYVAVVIPTFPSVFTPDDVRKLFDSFAGIDVAGVKVTMEEGLLRPIWPLHSQEVRDTLVQECAARNLDIYIHAMNPKMTREALKMHPHALVHASQSGSKRLARQVAESGAYVSPTLSILGISSMGVWPDDPLLRLTVPADELAAAQSPEMAQKFARAAMEVAAPKMSEKARDRLADRFQDLATSRLETALRTVKRLFEAGVRLTLGSDSGNWPINPRQLHGPSTHVELAMLGRAGLAPLDVIRAATLTPAQMLHLDGELGTVEVGKRADLVIVDGDPLTDVAALSQIAWVIRDGEARTPAEWMR